MGHLSARNPCQTHHNIPVTELIVTERCLTATNHGAAESALGLQVVCGELVSQAELTHLYQNISHLKEAFENEFFILQTKAFFFFFFFKYQS